MSQQQTRGLDPAVVVVTGPVGAGKSTTVGAMAGLLNARGRRVWAVDQDYLRSVYPAADDDPYGARLGIENLAACWVNVRRREVSAVLIADVMEEPGQAQTYADALGLSRVLVARLDVRPEELDRRLRAREAPEHLEWHLERAVVLQEQMQRTGVGDVVVEVGSLSPAEVAAEVCRRTGLL